MYNYPEKGVYWINTHMENFLHSFFQSWTVHKKNVYRFLTYVRGLDGGWESAKKGFCNRENTLNGKDIFLTARTNFYVV